MLGSLGGGPEPLECVCSLLPLGLGFTCRRRCWGPPVPRPRSCVSGTKSFPEAASSFRKMGTWAEKLSHWLRTRHRVCSGQVCTLRAVDAPLLLPLPHSAQQSTPSHCTSLLERKAARPASEGRPLLLAKLLQEGLDIQMSSCCWHMRPAFPRAQVS